MTWVVMLGSRYWAAGSRKWGPLYFDAPRPAHGPSYGFRTTPLLTSNLFHRATVYSSRPVAETVASEVGGRVVHLGGFPRT